jgi:hypothetical protein
MTFVIGYWVPLAPLVVELPMNADSLSWVSLEVEPLQFGPEAARLGDNAPGTTATRLSSTDATATPQLAQRRGR